MTKTLRNRFLPDLRSAAFAATLALLTAFAASPARADRCDDIATELANQIDGLKVRFRAANIVYLTHPAAKELSLGCRGENYSIEFYAKGDRKPKPEFLTLVGAITAVVFTVTKDDTTTGTSRFLPQTHGHPARRQGQLSLSPPQHGMHAHQDRRVDRGHPRQGRIGPLGMPLRPISSLNL